MGTLEEVNSYEKSLSWTDGGEIQGLQVQMCQQNHKAIDDKHKDESMHE